MTYREVARSGSASHDLVEDAVLRRLETLSDAVGHLSPKLRAEHPEIAWRRITAFRNVLAHGYMSIDPKRIDEVIDNDLPPLRSFANDQLGIQ
jgi:uncharacterized protein with HEPN domain